MRIKAKPRFPRIITKNCICFLGKTPSAVPSTSKKVITNKTVLPPVVVKQEFGNHAKPRPPNHNNNNNNIPSHLDVPKKLPSAKKSPPPEIKLENNGIKMEGESFLFESLELGAYRDLEGWIKKNQ